MYFKVNESHVIYSLTLKCSVTTRLCCLWLDHIPVFSSSQVDEHFNPLPNFLPSPSFILTKYLWCPLVTQTSFCTKMLSLTTAVLVIQCSQQSEWHRVLVFLDMTLCTMLCSGKLRRAVNVLHFKIYSSMPQKHKEEQNRKMSVLMPSIY